VLPWLAWERRLKMFQQFRELAAGEEAMAQLIYSFGAISDRRAAEPLWAILNEKDVSENMARTLHQALLTSYLGNRYYVSNHPSSVKKAMVQAVKPRMETGGEWQRIAALALLMSVAQDEAAQAAVPMADNATLAESARSYAFQVQLLTQTSKEAREAALSAFKGTDTWRKKIAIRYITHGKRSLYALPYGFYMSYSYPESSGFSRNGTPIVPKPPEGVDLARVRSLLSDPDPEISAGAGYILAVAGESDGIEPLLAYWRHQQKSDLETNKLVYRAVAVLDDSNYIPILRDIFARLDKSELYEFYWTIRIMTGPEILKFRKQVRDAMSESEPSQIPD
jgi:hypothetical protein